MIAWADLLQALEGDIVQLPAPKNFCRRDLELSADTPFFCYVRRATSSDQRRKYRPHEH